MYEDENNLYHYSYRKGDEQNPNAPIDTRWCARSSAASSAQA